MSKTNTYNDFCPFCGKLLDIRICESCDYDADEDRTLDLVEQFEANELAIDFGLWDAFGS